MEQRKYDSDEKGGVEVIAALSEKITRYLCEQDVIEEKYQEIYFYGYEVLLDVISKTTVLLVAGIVWEKLVATLVFLVVFISLRGVCGGYHAKCRGGCLVVTVGLYSIVMIGLGAGGKILQDKATFCIMLSMLLMCETLLHNPAENENKKVPEAQKKRNKKIAAVLIFIFQSASFFLRFSNAEIAAAFFLTTLEVGMLTIVRGDDKREKATTRSN